VHGTDPRVADGDLRDMQKRFAATSTASTGGRVVTQPTSSATSVADQPPTSLAVEEWPVFIVHRSYIPDAPPGPSGLAPAYLAKLARPKWAVPENGPTYFGMYFALTGLGGIHVVAALAVTAAVLITVLRGRSCAVLTPRLVTTAAAWWWATGCWGVVYLLLYA